MSQRCQTATLDDLLAHAEWIRRLSDHLVRGDPEDAVQESWLAALRSPPDAARPARPWLASVLRNAARKRFRDESSRRAREERAAALPDEVPTPAQLLERAETSRMLSDLVLALDEPLRQAVLLRYYEGLSSADIARALGLPAGTVRWRLKDAVDRLRAALDAKHGGDRPAWCLLLAPSALARGAATLPAGAVAATVGAKLFAAGAVAALAVAFAVASQLPPAAVPPPSPAPAAPPLLASAPAPSPKNAAPEAPPPREEPAQRSPTAEPEPAAPQEPGPDAPPAPFPLTPAEQARRRHAVEDALDTMTEGPAEPEPIDWPEDVPEAYRPDAFKAIVQRILADCAIPAELVKLECDEPPCIAALRLRDQPQPDEFLGECPLWAETFGSRTAITQAHKVVACADGSVERAAFVYRFWPAVYRQHTGYMLRRLRERVRQLRDHWACSP